MGRGLPSWTATSLFCLVSPSGRLRSLLGLICRDSFLSLAIIFPRALLTEHPRTEVPVAVSHESALSSSMRCNTGLEAGLAAR
jgi:hypothetical protein